MLRGHKSDRQTAISLRNNLLCPWQYGQRIKEQQLALFAGRTSCHYWWANQFRLLLSSLAYILLEQYVGCTERHRNGACLRKHVAPEINQNRGCYLAQYTTYSFVARKQRSIPKTLLSCCSQTDTWIAHLQLLS